MTETTIPGNARGRYRLLRKCLPRTSQELPMRGRGAYSHCVLSMGGERERNNKRDFRVTAAILGYSHAFLLHEF